jgi:hypothetical protein
MGLGALRLYKEPPVHPRSAGKPAPGLRDLLQRLEIRAALFYVFILGGRRKPTLLTALRWVKEERK